MCPDGEGRVGCGPQEMFRACADVEISATARARVNSRTRTTAADRRGSGSDKDMDTGKSFWGSRRKNVVHDHGTKHKPSTAETSAISVKKTPSSFRVSGNNGYSFFSMGPKSAESESSETSLPSSKPAQRRRGGYYNNDDSLSSSSSTTSEKVNKRRRNRNKKRKPLKKRRKNEHVHLQTESRRRRNSTKSPPPAPPPAPPTPPQGGRFTYYEQTGDSSNSHAYFWVPAPGSETRKTPSSSASQRRRTQALHSDQRASVQLLPAEEDLDKEPATSLESYFRMFTVYTRESKLLAKYFLDSVSDYLS